MGGKGRSVAASSYTMVATMFVLLLWSMISIAEAAPKAINGGINRKGALDPASTHYLELFPILKTGQERVICLARGRCFLSILRCPVQCPQRKPKKNRIVKGCFIDCSSRCETTCKRRKPNCNGYGSICYDPRFVGGDGVMFYFHGAKGRDFAIVSDTNLHINAHFIGIRPPHRSRDFTWVQSLCILFHSHTLVVAARRVSIWHDHVDTLTILFNGREIHLPHDVEAEWHSNPKTSSLPTTTAITSTSAIRGELMHIQKEIGREDSEEIDVVVERLEETNNVKVIVEGLVELDVKVVPVTDEDDRIHGYGLSADDAFAHLEMQFKFGKLTEEVEGVLGKTYRQGYVSSVKKGVAMPIMGGEDKYLTSSLLSADCSSCRFRAGTSGVDPLLITY